MQITLNEDEIDRNMIYCEDTHSFVHRLYDSFKGENGGY